MEGKVEEFPVSTVWISDLASLSLPVPVDTLDINVGSLISDRTF